LASINSIPRSFVFATRVLDERARGAMGATVTAGSSIAVRAERRRRWNGSTTTTSAGDWRGGGGGGARAGRERASGRDAGRRERIA